MQTTKRRDFLKTAGLAASAWALGNASCRSADEKASDKPNIIFFMADDMNADMFNFRAEGKGKNLTPNLDRLVREGAILWGQHVSAPVCSPSRYTCLTGRYASRTQNKGFISATQRAGMSIVTWNTKVYPDDHSVAKLLQKAGYATGMVGKNHTINVPGWKRIPLDADPRDPAVDRRLKENAKRSHDAIRACGFDYAASIYHNNAERIGPEPLCVHNMDWVAKGGLDFIDRYKDRPFFLYFSTTLTHSPYAKEQSWGADPLATPDGYLPKPLDVMPPREALSKRIEESGLETGGKKEMVLWLDDALGALIRKLEEHNLMENTVILFFNDNGQEGKGSIYQSGTSAPSIVWRKTPFSCGHESRVRVSNIDFAPTVLDLAGVKVTADTFDGVSFKPVLEGTTKRLHEALFFELGFTRGVLKDNWKYIALRYPPDAGKFGLRKDAEHMKGVKLPPGNPPFGHIGGNGNEANAMETQPAYFDRDQLYDLSKDPKEQKNLAGDPAFAEKLAEMKQELQKFLKRLPGGFAELKPA